MTEQKLKELFTSELNNSAPDKDALWAKIEGRLTPKENAQPVAAPRKPLRLTTVKAIAAVAACVAVVIALPALVRNSTSVGEDAISSFDSVAANSPDMMNDAADSASENGIATVPVKEFYSYNELPFDSYSETVLECNGEPFGGSYFVEEDILAQTDTIVRGEVTRVYLGNDGESLMYDVAVSENYDGNEALITVESRSQYPLRRGREYLLPLAKTEQGYRTVFDGVPQTEFTSTDGMVLYNGWSSLTAEAALLEYPKQGEEDYFHDRMMYSPEGNITELIEKWFDMKGR